MEEFFLKVSEIDKGLRLDRYIIKNLKLPISRSKIQQLIKSEKIFVNQKPVKAHYKVKEGDLLKINIPEPPKTLVLPEEIPLDIIFEDSDLLIINKPSGMMTHPAQGRYSNTLVNALLNYGCQLSTLGGPLRPGIVHRLDKDTSGLMVIAKNDFAHQDLAEQFRSHAVKRKYIAIVKGRVLQEQGYIDYPLARHPQDPRKIVVSFNKRSREALTRYRVLKRYRQLTLLELKPHTGRTHQLRVHLKFCGHPILGDRRYSRADSFSRLALHATSLCFRHPRTKKFIEFHSALPACFDNFLKSRDR